MSKTQQLLAAATPAPWRIAESWPAGEWVDDDDDEHDGPALYRIDGPNLQYPAGDEEGYHFTEADAALIVHLRNTADAAQAVIEAARELRKGIGGFLWLGNNLHNVTADAIRFREFFDAATDDARKAYDAATAALAAYDEADRG